MSGEGVERIEGVQGTKQAPRVILASASPRRRELLGLICSDYDVLPSDFDESHVSTELPPVEYVVTSASRKARAVAKGIENGLIIGADTIVVVGGEILGKPSDEGEARSMLRALSGQTHQVYTGLALIRAADGALTERTAFERTDVTFRRMTDTMISRYVATGEPLDKAGAYAIQGKGAVLVERINGCYFNVVGLPVYLLSRLFEEFGIEVFGCQ